MKYINIATVRKLVSVNRIKQPIGPGETVVLSNLDIKMLSANSQFIIPFSEAIKK